MIARNSGVGALRVARRVDAPLLSREPGARYRREPTRVRS